VREHHRVEQADVARDDRRGELRRGAERSGPEEERAGFGERDAEALEQPQREQRVDDEAAGERVDAEERGEARGSAQ
jgi:hypothetical protein